MVGRRREEGKDDVGENEERRRKTRITMKMRKRTRRRTVILGRGVWGGRVRASQG